MSTNAGDFVTEDQAFDPASVALAPGSAALAPGPLPADLQAARLAGVLQAAPGDKQSVEQIVNMAVNAAMRKVHQEGAIYLYH